MSIANYDVPPSITSMLPWCIVVWLTDGEIHELPTNPETARSVELLMHRHIQEHGMDPKTFRRCSGGIAVRSDGELLFYAMKWKTPESQRNYEQWCAAHEPTDEDLVSSLRRAIGMVEKRLEERDE